jgi:hypothetical protein
VKVLGYCCLKEAVVFGHEIEECCCIAEYDRSAEQVSGSRRVQDIPVGVIVCNGGGWLRWCVVLQVKAGVADGYTSVRLDCAP